MSWGTSVLTTIKKYLDAIQGGTKTIEDVVVNQEAILDNIRSTQSAALLTLTGAEQTLYEFIPTTTSLFTGGYVDLTAMAADDIVIIRGYRKLKSGGAYVCFTGDLTYTGVPEIKCVELAGGRWVRYGIKFTIQQTQATTSYKTIDHEWADAAPGV